MVGIRQVAARVGLSIYTVSRALNGHPDVNAETRQRILEAALALGYHPNQSGIALRTGKTGSVGFILRTGAEMPMEGRFFLMSVLDGVQSVLRSRRLDLVALLCSSDDDPDAFLQRAVGRKLADALIVTDLRRGDPRVDYLLDRRIPFVTFGQSGTDRPYLWFDADIARMAGAAATRLLDAGHRSFAVFAADGGENFSIAFIEQFRALVEARGLPPGSVHAHRGAQSEEGGYRLARALAEAGGSRPTALVMLSEPMSLGVYRGLQERGILPGRDIAIIGRDSPTARFLYPTLTRFQLPLRDLGVEVARGLLHIMAHPGEATAFEGRQSWEATLIEGESDKRE